MVCLNGPYYFKFFKGYLPQILLGPFFNTLSYLLPDHFYSLRLPFPTNEKFQL